MGKQKNRQTTDKTAGQKPEPSACPAMVNGTSGEVRLIHTDRLTSGLAYQRPVNMKEVERLVREWDERLLDFVTVSYRDGRFHVVDGQHRISALRQMNGGRGVMVSCRVYNGLTYEQEAELCYKLDKAKKRLSLSQSTNALVESGMDPEALEIRRLVEECGFTWALGRKHGKTGEIVATRALVNAYRILGGAAFTRMLCLLKDTWNGSASSLTAAFLSGMALFVKTYETEVNDHVFALRLSRTEPEEISRRARADLSTNKTALRFARVILEKYNGKYRGGKLPYRFHG